jgi:hypothetical protein
MEKGNSPIPNPDRFKCLPLSPTEPEMTDEMDRWDGGGKPARDSSDARRIGDILFLPNSPLVV